MINDAKRNNLFQYMFVMVQSSGLVSCTKRFVLIEIIL